MNQDTIQNELNAFIAESIDAFVKDLQTRNLMVRSFENPSKALLSGSFTRKELEVIIRWMELTK